MHGYDAGRPSEGEYDPFYQRYIDRVPDETIMNVLEEQRYEIMGFLGSLDNETADYRYEPEKWSIKEVLGHLVDTERIFSTRALCFARNESTPLPGFEQDEYVREGCFGRRSLANLSREFEAVRMSTESLLGGFDQDQWGRSGVANEARMSVRAVAFIVVGHAAHHMSVIRERYFDTH
jgi:hypothetical protein